MNMKNSWNPMLNFISEIKTAYRKKFKREPSLSYNSDIYRSCVEVWVEELDIQKYIDMMDYIETSQKKDYVIFHYINFEKLSNIIPGEEFAISYRRMWDIYDGLLRECRSVVIDVKNEALVNTPFAKFFNMDERPETSKSIIEDKIKKAKKVEFSNKMDGSMMSASFYQNEIVVSSSQSLDSWRVEDMTHYLTSAHKEMIMSHPNQTFIFEYISLKDPHIVQYPKEMQGIYLIGIRDKETGVTYDYNTVIKTATSYPDVKNTEVYKKSFSDVLDSLDKVRGNDAEGYVANIDGFRVKIKYDDYLLMKNIMDRKAVGKTVIRAIADGNFDDIYSRIPENKKELALMVAERVNGWVSDTDTKVHEYYNTFSKITDIKEFMIAVTKEVPKEYQGYVRMLYKGKSYQYLKKFEDTDQPCYKSPAELGIDMREIIDEYNQKISFDENERS